MTTTAILDAVASAIGNLRPAARLDAYLFGSAVEPRAAWSDVDVLLVCGDETDGQAARRALLGLCRDFPIDLTIMTTDEEAEFDFIRSERCQWFAAIGLKSETATARLTPIHSADGIFSSLAGRNRDSKLVAAEQAIPIGGEREKFGESRNSPLKSEAAVA